MKISTEQSYDLLGKHGSYVMEVCDRCGQAISPFNRFTRYGDPGVWCSRECRDGNEAHVPGICKGCGAELAGRRKGAKYCSDLCRMRQNGQGRPNNPKTHIQNKPLAGAILASVYIPTRKTGSAAKSTPAA